jgi:hypothetical protein
MQGAPEGKQGPPIDNMSYWIYPRLGFTRDTLDEGAPSQATY